jgi:hypothetical protein
MVNILFFIEFSPRNNSNKQYQSPSSKYEENKTLNSLEGIISTRLIKIGPVECGF